MKLSVIERITIQGILPEKGSFTNLKLLRVVRESLSFTDAENKELNFTNTEVNGEMRTTWNQNNLVNKVTGKKLEGDQESITKMVNANPDNFEMRPVVDDVEIKIGEVVTQMIIENLKNLELKEELEDKHFSIYEKFIENKDP